MRQIKFKAWDWEKMYVPPNDLEHTIWMLRYTYPDTIVWIAFWKNFGDCDYTSEHIRNMVFMQYTWLLDKNWVEIYEGDILDMYNKWVVTFYQWRFTVFYNWWTEEEIENRSWWFYSVLVIGNIYENPELLD